MSVLYGIDVSHHQGAVNWKQVRAEGFAFGIAKIGGDLTDTYYHRNIAGMRAAGLIAGGYWFLRPGGGAAQARECLQLIGDPDGLLVALDVERGGSGQTPSIADVRAFVAEWRTRSAGHPLVLYLPRWYWQSVGYPNLGDLGCVLWSSRYASTDSGYASTLYSRTPASYWAGYGGIGKASMLQFSSAAKVAGLKVDADAFTGSLEQLRALTSSTRKPPVVDPKLLGGALASAPAIVSWGPARIDAFARGANDRLYHAWSANGGRNWSGWEDQGGKLTSAPSACSWGPDRIDVVVTGIDRAVYHKVWDGRWRAFENLGGALVGAPSITSDAPGRVTVAGAGVTKRLYTKTFDKGWSGWAQAAR